MGREMTGARRPGPASQPSPLHSVNGGKCAAAECVVGDQTRMKPLEIRLSRDGLFITLYFLDRRS